MAKKSNYFKGLLNAIIKIEDLQSDVESFKEKIENEDEIVFKDVISILTKTARYFTSLEDVEEEFDEKEIEQSANALIGLYKNKSKEISGKNLDQFREIINILLFSIGYYPLDEKGNEIEDEDEIDSFEEEIFNNFI